MPSLIFTPGLELSRRFYLAAVRPYLDKYFPAIPHAAAKLGPGSDVLGFDTPMSMDHDWGPMVLLFLREQDWPSAESIRAILQQHLPPDFEGFPINPSLTEAEQTIPPRNGAVRFVTVREFFWEQLHYATDQPLTVLDWLTLPSQILREMTAGAVYHDGIGELSALRARLAWYPRDVWFYLLAAGWRRIAQENHLMARAGYVGDELGSSIIGARLVRDLMNLCFLMEKQYAPYPKWFGSAFQQLSSATTVGPWLWQAQRAENWRAREGALGEACRVVAHQHNQLGITEKVAETVASFHSRPFQVIQADQFVDALLAQIKEETIKHIADRSLIGNVDQFCDNTDIRANIAWREKLAGLYP
ncbi:MAG: DUF4037 domain-containing protein [Chloroflexi bacterium]|nr:DUF4037 domain-containing protein [Chloroflexota bacterium]